MEALAVHVTGSNLLFYELSLRDGLAGILLTGVLVNCDPGGPKLPLAQHLAQVVYTSNVMPIPAGFMA